jgi:hypothetical protein
MKQTAYLWSSMIICAVLIVVLLFKINSLENKVRLIGEPNGSALTTLQNSVKLTQADANAAKELAPGLGEFMTTIQLHAGKLWFAAKAANWELAKYELDELKETMEAAKGLNEEKNGVKISNVLDSVLQTQVANLEKTMESKSQSAFKKSYDETLSACNGCHTEAGYKFIHIVRPTAPPVTNQKW